MPQTAPVVVCGKSECLSATSCKPDPGNNNSSDNGTTSLIYPFLPIICFKKTAFTRAALLNLLCQDGELAAARLKLLRKRATDSIFTRSPAASSSSLQAFKIHGAQWWIDSTSSSKRDDSSFGKPPTSSSSCMPLLRTNHSEGGKFGKRSRGKLHRPNHISDFQ